MCIHLLSLLSLSFVLWSFAAVRADENPQATPTTPIPSVGTGLIDLQEIKPTATLDIKAGQSRSFKTKTKILRVSVSDPNIAEPVVISEREFILLGKAPGAISIFLWCEGDSAASKKPM